MDWIHCNICYIQPGELPKRQYNLTSCGHIFCAFCEKPGEIAECKVCKNKCITTEITGGMPQEVQIYFEDPDVTMSKLTKVVDFQRGHRIRLSETRRIVGQKYQRAKSEIVRLNEEVNSLKRSLEWYVCNYGPMGPEMQVPKSGPPLLPQNSQASQAIRAGANNQYKQHYQQQQFRTPNMSQGSNYGGYRYNVQASTPGTPSDISISPSDRFTPQSHPYYSQSKSHYRAGITPPMSNLKLLSIASQKSREGKPF